MAENVLGTIFGRADALKRQLYDMIRNPSDYASMVGGRTQENLATAQALQNQAFSDPQNPLRITNPQALNQLTQMITSGPLGFAPAGITAYHGSPYLFRQFDPMKVGTGEGAQAYGVGSGYTAEARPVAEEYARNISRSKFIDESKKTGQSSAYTTEVSQLQQMVGDTPIQDYYSKLQLQADRLSANRAEDAYAKLDIVERLGLGSNIPEVRQYAKDSGYSKAVQEWVEKELVPKYKPAGFLYKGDIPDEILPKFLDWDKPLTKDAPQEVKDAFNSIIKKYPELKEPFFKAFKEGQPGNHYYSLLNDYAKTGDLYKNQLFASQTLEEAGIRGIRYLDQGSRGEGKGTSNFIPFRPEDFKIQEINDIPIEQWYQRGLLDRPMSAKEEAKAAWEANPENRDLYEAYRKLRLEE